MKITPTPLTAALAGLFSAAVLPHLWSYFGGLGSSDSVGLVVAFLLVVALPAHAFVVGFGYRAAPGALDTALLRRMGAWLTAAAVTIAVAAWMRQG